MAKRIQRKRTKGWTMPPNSFYVGRPTAYGNPYVVGQDVSTAQEAVDKYKEYMHEWRGSVSEYVFNIWIERIRGKDLVCWCPLDSPCHADVLLKLANKEVKHETR